MHLLRITVFAAAFLLSTAIHAQPCACPATFDWMVTTFEQNDAGFQLVVDRKSQAAYAEHTQALRAKADSAGDLIACSRVLDEWLHWFRKGHIGIGPTEQAQQADKQQKASTPVGATTFPAGRMVKITEAELVKRLERAGSGRHPLEGVWALGPYRVGIVRQPKDSTHFDAVILASENKNWRPGEVKVELERTADGRYAGTFYMGDHSPEPVEAALQGSGGSMLQMRGVWMRQVPAPQFSPAERMHQRAMDAEAPFLERLSDNTLYLRIPSFAFEQKVLIDSVLAAHDALIRSTANLIIDIRYGTGGSDASYGGLIPYLYTGPIRSVGVKLRATALNAAGYEAYADMFGRDTEDGRACLDVAARMRASLGSWIEGDAQRWSVDSTHTALPFPQRVGILCNEGNGSTDEQFLLEARTSYKVKLYGRPTFGSLDASNMRQVTSPDGCFQLGYTMSLSHRLPHMPVDVMGIQPDHYLDGGIPEMEWVEHVQGVLEGR
ncbi:MAG TPA: S41 family peptidase [Flavobacteriales bacterium]|nr:S41 family peptidase [Flavobacteriales bacterium]HMR27827.1 S41 family peptidase [Flavobacteriales bacterium]